MEPNLTFLASLNQIDKNTKKRKFDEGEETYVSERIVKKRKIEKLGEEIENLEYLPSIFKKVLEDYKIEKAVSDFTDEKIHIIEPKVLEEHFKHFSKLLPEIENNLIQQEQEFKKRCDEINLATVIFWDRSFFY